MMNSKRGISPLIATVLIIGFTVALGAVIMMWGSGFVTNLQESSEISERKSLSCAATGLELTNAEQTAPNKLKLLVENTGQENVKSVIIRITGDKGTASITRPGINIAAKKAYDAHFTPAEVGIITNIEVIPTLEINQKTEPCTPGITLAAEAPQEEEVEEWTEEASKCGNDAIDTDWEECDGGDLGGQDCTTLEIGYTGGTLACTDSCAFNTEGCEGTTTCGNREKDATEQCEGIDLGGETCKTQGFTGGTLYCTNLCQIDTIECTGDCGNGEIDAGEACDGAALDGKTCYTEEFIGGTLACLPDCSGLDTSGCASPVCGNGKKEGTEACDGSELGGIACGTGSFPKPPYVGVLTCKDDCTIDASLCTECGNGIIEGNEACEGSNMGGKTCVSQGFTGGTARCTNICTFDASLCIPILTKCGNGAIDPTEQCDKINMNGQTCQTLGWTKGTLACLGSCVFYIGGCTL